MSELTEATVDELPPCDFCRRRGRTATAAYHARIPLYGPWSWSYVCETCFTTLECSLGTGKGQRLFLRQ